MKHETNTVQSPTDADVLIIGGGFAGVRCALDVAKKSPEMAIMVVSQEKDFTYYPSMYRFVHGSPRAHVAIPLKTIFERYPNIVCVEDTVESIDTARLCVGCASGASYCGDRLVLAVGSETNYFHIEGVGDYSFNFKSLEAAATLRDRVAELFSRHVGCDTAEMLVALHFVIVGGGASGVELAGELAAYTRKLAQAHKLPESLVTIDIVERNERLLSRLDPRVSKAVEKRLRLLGVNILLNRSLVKSESWTTYLGDMTLGAKTIIWTAGVQPAKMSQGIEGLSYTERGKVMVDEHLQAVGHENFFVAGDITDRPDAGLAQVALEHGACIARIIQADWAGVARPEIKSSKHWHVLPIGPGWGALQRGNFVMLGYVAWVMRFVADIRFYLSILPLKKVFQILTAHRKHPHVSHQAVSPREESSGDGA